MKEDYCFWTVAPDAETAEAVRRTVSSAQTVDMFRPFHVWTDEEVPGAKCHPLGRWEPAGGIFRFTYLRDAVLPLGHEHAVWLEPGTEFRRHPGSMLHPLRRAPVHVPLLWDLAEAASGAEWGGASCGHLLEWMREGGVVNRQVWAAHPGFFIVHRDAVETLFRLAFELWHRAEHDGCRLTCEPLLAYAAQMLMGDPRWHHLSRALDLWLPQEEMHRSVGGPALRGV